MVWPLLAGGVAVGLALWAWAERRASGEVERLAREDALRELVWCQEVEGGWVGVVEQAGQVVYRSEVWGTARHAEAAARWWMELAR